MESHVRIDEGVKRGPRPPSNPHQAPAKRPDGQSSTIPAGLDPDHVLELYLTAETTSEIAAQLGVRRHTLVRWLRAQRPEQWKQVQAVRAMCRKDDGENGVAVACDALSLARARELLRAGQWELERLDRDYAPQQHITLELTGDLGERLMRARERTVEGEVVRIGQGAAQQVAEDGVAAEQQIASHNDVSCTSET